jgi:integrase/recombinase XerD
LSTSQQAAVISVVQPPFQVANAKMIEVFIEELPPISLKRQKKHRTILTHVSNWWLKKPFEETTKLDLKNIVIAINSKEDFKDWTKSDYRMVTKRFYRWLRNQEFVKDIKAGGAEETVGPEDILDEKELSALFGCCTNLRDKALSKTAYESACRPHEFLGLRKSDIAFDDYGAILYVRKGKTGARRIRVVEAAPLLANWIENHPLKDRDASLWVDMSSNTKFRALKWTGYRKVILRLTKSAHIEKRVSAYIFRHTRLTHLAKFMTEAQLCEFAGWRQGSRMPRMYIHLSGRDVDDALLKSYGLKKKEEESELEGRIPRKCVRCSTLCEPDAEICNKCGMALSLQAAMKRDDKISQLNDMVLNLTKVVNDLQKTREEELAKAKIVSQ